MGKSLRQQLGDRIREVRRSKRMTQVQLAKTTKLTQSHWSQIENGRLKFQIDTLEVVAQGLRSPLSVIFEGIVLDDLPE